MCEIMSSLEQLGPRGLARFEASLDPAWISEALAASGKASVRKRKLPAEQAVWLVLGMGLYEDRSIVSVVEHLDLVVPGKGPIGRGGISQARGRLGPEPMRLLFKKVAEAWANSPGHARWRDLSLFAVDGTTVRVQDSDENLAHFGKPSNQHGDGGYPQARIAALMNVDTRLLVDVRFGPYNTDERVLASELFATVPENSLTIIDRGFYSYELVASMIRKDSRHVLARVRSDLHFEVVDTLSDGSQRVRIPLSRELRRKNPALPDAIEGRIIAYQHPGGEPGRLLVTLLDHERYPADELINLYHERWEIEIAFDELKTHMLERRECLRSLTPVRVEQELWGLLLVYNLVRREMLHVADAHKVPPQRISFWSSLLWIRNFWITAWQVSPGTIPRHLAELRQNLGALLLPPRRSDRRYPRHVKIKVSPFPRNRRRSASRKALSEPLETAK
jgi:hypothetical protein